MDETRRLLDELMGADRNGEPLPEKRRLDDKDVCHYYLAGMCPFEEFERTKHDVGPCPLAAGHDDDLRAEFEALRPEEKDRLGFERELLKYIDKLMLELNTKVRRNEERLAKENVPVIGIDDQKVLDRMGQEMQEMLRRSEVLGEQGDVDGSQAAATQAEAIKARRKELEEEALETAKANINRYGEQEVCPYSGVIVNKEESRMRDHKNGRNYRAWVKTHEVYNKLKEALKKQEPNNGHRSVSRDRQQDHKSSRHHERDRDRDRERDRDRDRDRHKREQDRRRRERDDSRDDRPSSRRRHDSSTRR
ncbi:g457 [Coccomyxa viridis]|uniref:G457 protein n=1 Tax=Coccomyxa viridis TaxID=1274662 RepID=A0ABP1FHD0_9CHLO